MLTAFGLTHPGRVRPSNEDAMHWDVATGIFVVADGMGGHQAGEVASRLAIDTIRAFLASTQGDRDLTWPYGFNPGLSFNGNRLVTATKRRSWPSKPTEKTLTMTTSIGWPLSRLLVRTSVMA